MKKLLSLTLALIMILTTFTPVFAQSKQDLYNESGQILKKAGVLEGSNTGDLMLNDNLKRQDMVVLMSRLYKQEHIAKTYSGKHKFIDITNSFYNPYIAWAVNKDLIHGMSPNKFGFNQYVTVQQFQTVLLRVLNYNEEARDENWHNIPSLAEKYNLMEGVSVKPTEKLNRGLMAVMTVNALKQEMKDDTKTLAEYLNIELPVDFSVVEKVNIDRNIVKIEGTATGVKNLKLNLKPISNNIKLVKTDYDLNLDTDGKFSFEISNLQAGQYVYKFISGNKSTNAKTFTIKDLPFELLGVKADNLKEITVNFSTPIDKASSQFLNNYYTDAGTIKSVRLEDDDTTLILTLNETMTNLKHYKLSINKIKSQKGEELKIQNEEFEAFDNKAPEINEVHPLGNKGLRVYLSEPVVSAIPSNFKIDGKRYSGKVEMENNVITLLPYINISEGKHVLTVSGLYDYAGYRGVDQNINFDIVKDNTVPKIVDVVATTEVVIIQFNKDIDPSSISRTNFYWKSGSIKTYPSNVKTINDQIILDFTRKNLPTYEISVYINNVDDYWGNRIKSEEIRVKPELDTTPPEVIGLKVAEDGKSITVYFSKNVEGKNRAFYTINDENNKPVYIRNIEGSGREYKIVLNNPLPIGTNTIKIQDVYDTTVLKNKIEPYVEQIYMKDVEKPVITSYSGNGRDIVIIFSKEMDAYTVENPENYILKINNERIYMPRDTEFIPLANNSKSWRIVLPEKINNKTVDIGKSGNIREIDILSIKALNGIPVDPQTLHFTDVNQGETKIEEAILTSPDIIEVKFNLPIYYASYNDFIVKDRKINDVRLDGGNIVQILLEDDGKTTSSGNLTVVNNNNIETALGTNAKSQTIEVVDQVPPRILPDINELSMYGNTIELPFTEKLYGDLAHLFKEDLIVESLDYGVLDKNEYSTSLNRDGNIIIIRILNNKNNYYGYRIRLVDRPGIIRDLNSNVIEPDNWEYYTK